jgi:hypothetical protein
MPEFYRINFDGQYRFFSTPQTSLSALIYTSKMHLLFLVSHLSSTTVHLAFRSDIRSFPFQVELFFMRLATNGLFDYRNAEQSQ